MVVQRVLILVGAISVVLLLLSGWGWQAPAQAAQGGEGSKGGESGDVTLRIAGEKGTPFSGTCSVGEEEHDISGQVPQSFEYDLNGQKLECEIRRQGAGSSELKIVLRNENTRSVQQSVGAQDTTISLVYENGTLSSLVSSSSSQNLSSIDSSSSSAANDGARGPDGESSSTSSENEAERSGNDRESLADQIQKRVDEILERVLP